MKRVRCPRCRKDFVRRSSPQGGWDRTLHLAGLHPFHCQLCGHRFRARGDAEAPPAEDHTERRDYERVPVRLLAEVTWEGGQAQGIVTDISMSGCSLEIEAPISEGDLLGLQVRAEEDAPAIAVDAAVVRSAGPWRVGLRFLRIQDAEKSRLRDLLHRVFQEYAAQRLAARAAAVGEAPAPALESGGGPPPEP